MINATLYRFSLELVKPGWLTLQQDSGKITRDNFHMFFTSFGERRLADYSHLRLLVKGHWFITAIYVFWWKAIGSLQLFTPFCERRLVDYNCFRLWQLVETSGKLHEVTTHNYVYSDKQCKNETTDEERLVINTDSSHQQLNYKTER